MEWNEIEIITAREAADKMRSGSWSVSEVTALFLKRIRETEPEIHAFITVDEEGALLRAEMLDRIPVPERTGRLFGVPVSVKDNILTKGLRTTAGSRFLENYIPVQDAGAAERLLLEGAVIVGKTNLDEFGMGSETDNPVYGRTVNPKDRTRSPGGSSGGAAASVLAMECMAALGTDTGGSVRQPAAYCGIYGMKPTYGAVSRYGLISYASSMDQIGVLARDPGDVRLVMSVISGRDERDDTSCVLPEGVFDSIPAGRPLRIGIPAGFLNDPKLSDSVRAAISEFSGFLKDHGAVVRIVDLPYTELHVPVYYMLAACEASSNLGRYDGIRYGKNLHEFKDLLELYRENRTAGFSGEVRKRILAGTYILSEERYTELYLKASDIRERIRMAYRKLFTEYDLLLTPVVRGNAPFLTEKAAYDDDICTVGANLAGLPAGTVPVGESAVQLIAGPMNDRLILDISERYHDLTKGGNV